MKIAAIDIGSNAGRFVICRAWRDEDEVRTHQVEFIRYPFRLGDDVFRAGSISIEKQAQLLKFFKVSQLLMELHEVEHYHAFATSALREASNAADVRAEIKAQTGLELQIIDGGKEAELIFKAHGQLLQTLGNYLFIDVGGGSAELTLNLEGQGVVVSESFNIGTVRSLRGLQVFEEYTRMKLWIEKHIVGQIGLIGVATGGNINKLYTLAGADKSRFISLKKVEELHKELAAMPLVERINHLGLNPDRADVIVPAAEIYLSVLRWSKISKLYVSGLGLRDGIIAQLASEHLDEIRPDVPR